MKRLHIVGLLLFLVAVFSSIINVQLWVLASFMYPDSPSLWLFPIAEFLIISLSYIVYADFKSKEKRRKRG